MYSKINCAECQQRISARSLKQRKARLVEYSTAEGQKMRFYLCEACNQIDEQWANSTAVDRS